jgi:hypothetical protein
MFFKGVFTVRKCLLVVFIGMVLAINIYGIVHKHTIEEVKEVDHIAESTITVYME